MASYFDILFAINEYPHPGEKRLIEITLSKCSKLPVLFEENIRELIYLAGQGSNDILKVIDQAIENLTTLIKKEGLLSDD